MVDIRDLGDGFTARKWPHETEWRLMKDNKLYLSRRTIQELRDWLLIRAEWRAAKKEEESK